MTSNSSFETEIAVAGGSGDADDRIEGIKTAVARQIRATDPSVEAKFTDYFNHLAVPDLVLRWKQENASRPVFIRTHSEPRWLQADLKSFTTKDAVVYATTSLELSEPNVPSTTLLAAPAGLEALSARRKTSSSARLLSHAVIRGGAGVVDRGTAENASDVTSAGFDGASDLSRTQVAAAANLWSGLLSRSEATRMVRVLQAVWEGSGGTLADFPSPVSLSGNLSDSDLIYLLTELPDADTEFWSRAAWSVTSEQLARLPLEEPAQAALQVLMQAQMGRMAVKALRIFHEDARLDESTIELRWLTSRGCIVLRGSDWAGYFAPTSQTELPAIEPYDGVSVSTARQRASRVGRRITDVRLRDAKSSITWESLGAESVLDNVGFTQLAVSTNATLEQATVAMSDGRHLICDFTTQTALGKTSARFTVDDLIEVGFPLVFDGQSVELDRVLGLAAAGEGLLND